MRLVMDLLVGFLGYLVSWFLYELLIKPWWNRPRKAVEDVWRPVDLPSPLQVAEITKQVKRVTRRHNGRPRLNPQKRYSVDEILAMARKQKN